MNVYRNLVRPTLFALNAEAAHHGTVNLCSIIGGIPGVPAITRQIYEYSATNLETTIAGIALKNPIGLAAGWDKNGRTLSMLGGLGFGFAEIGSVSARPSLGNPKPRLFRIPKDDGIVVNYGLPNDGVDIVAKRLESRRASCGLPIGVNLVKTNDGPAAKPATEDEVTSDYYRSVSRIRSCCEYITLNLSCPNAGGGPSYFQQPGRIARLLDSLDDIEITVPVFLKVAPDPSPESVERLIAQSERFAFVRGVIFNLPTGKPASLSLETSAKELAVMPGAVSGKPVSSLMNQCIAEFYRRAPTKRFAIIGSGGVFNAEDAYHKIQIGASLVQLYTAMVYHGPGIVGRINRGLSQLLQRDGLRNIEQAVGVKA